MISDNGELKGFWVYKVEIRCETCGSLLGVVNGDGMIVARQSKGAGRDPRIYYWPTGVMPVRCCGKLRIYKAKDGEYQTSTVLTEEWVQTVAT